jgi:hypothetical protein
MKKTYHINRPLNKIYFFENILTGYEIIIIPIIILLCSIVLGNNNIYNKIKSCIKGKKCDKKLIKYCSNELHSYYLDDNNYMNIYECYKENMNWIYDGYVIFCYIIIYLSLSIWIIYKLVKIIRTQKKSKKSNNNYKMNISPV